MPNILLVDDDLKARTLVAKALSRPHRIIDVASHGEEALEHIRGCLPDLIITDVVMPRMNGWTLVRHLRTTAATAFIPVIFMTGLDSASYRIRGFRMGADDYITKPVDLDELELRVQNVLHRAHKVRSTLPHGALEGDLAQFGLATPLTLLEMEHKTGRLVVERGTERVTLVLKDGLIIGASEPERTAVDCVCDLLTWTSGRFTFDEVDVGEGVASGSTTSILLEAARRMDESA